MWSRALPRPMWPSWSGLTTGVPDEHAEALAPELFRRADGNPFFVTELVRLLDSERRVRPGEAVTDIPAAVGDVVRQRVRRLPENSQGLLRVASAIGREFDLDVLGLTAGLEDDDLLDALEPAIISKVRVAGGPAAATASPTPWCGKPSTWTYRPPAGGVCTALSAMPSSRSTLPTSVRPPGSSPTISSDRPEPVGARAGVPLHVYGRRAGRPAGCRSTKPPPTGARRSICC